MVTTASAALLAFLQIMWACGVRVSFDDPVPPKIIAVMSMQRSGSTTLSRLIASHKCVVWGNEIWDHNKLQDVLGAHAMTGLDEDYSSLHPVDFLLQVNEIVCKSSLVPEECNGWCSIVVKVFDIHDISESGLMDLVRCPEVGIVILQRSLSERYSSKISASMNGDWNTVPSKSRPEHEMHPVVPYEERNKYDTWFSFLRNTLSEADKVYIEVSFAMVKTCRLFDTVLPSLLSFFGLDIQDGVYVENMWEDDTIEEIAEECETPRFL